jgi:hypothetical protein
MKESEGAVCQHGIVYIDGVGVVFPGERGIYVLGNDDMFQFISRRIESTWDGLNRRKSEKWHAVHHRRRDEYILFCPQDTGVTTAILWNYRRNAFAVLEFNMEIVFSQVMEDKDDDSNRLMLFDDEGQVYEYDVAGVDSDGATRGSFVQVTGTVQTGTITTTTFKLVGDASLPVDADGLKGCPVTINGETRVVTWNDASFVEIDTALTSAPTVGNTWELGVIFPTAKTGRIDMGDHTRMKKFDWSELSMDPSTGSSVSVTGQIDEGREQSYVRPASRQYLRAGPWIGRGRTITLTVSDIDGGKPNNPWEVSSYKHAFHPRGRAPWPR